MEIPRKLVAAGTALAFTLSGCTSPDTTVPFDTPAATHAPADPTEKDPLRGGAETARRLLGANAAVHIIDVPVSNAKSAKKLELYSYDEKETDRFVRDLSKPKGKFRSTLGKTFAHATLQRYKPSAVNYKKTAPVKLEGGCIDYWHDDELQGLYATIRAAAHPDRLNIAVVEAFVCKPPKGESEVAGYASPDIIPVIAKTTLAEANETVVHEAGHYLGLPHAGIAECDDPKSLQGCTTWDTGDYWSLMSYRWVASAFTAPELYKLGLLRPDEVVDVRGASVKGQELTLTDMSHKEGVKLIIGQTATENALYLSWSKDDDAGYREKCTHTTDFEMPPGVKERDFLYSTSVYDKKRKKERSFMCYMVDKTKQDHSLQMRVDDKALYGKPDEDGPYSSFMLVTQKGQQLKNTDVYVNQYRSFMDPEQDVYTAGSMPVAYVSADHDKAVVRIG